MRKLFSILAASAVSLLMITCSSKTQTAENAEKEAQKCLVLYYSQTGATKTVAEQLRTALNCDIEEIVAEEPYSGSYDQTIARCMQEQKDNVIPKIKPLKSDISKYDVIFLGYPVWFGTYARPIMGLLANNDFAGKKVVPFCTFGSGGLEATKADLEAALPKAEIANGYGVRNARVSAMPEELNRFLIENGYIDGQVPQLPEFSEQKPVTEAETAIFNAACGDYQFPLGTPVTAGSRAVEKGIEYKFTAKSKDMTGKDVESTIYVIAPASEDAKPEFTRVAR